MEYTLTDRKAIYRGADIARLRTEVDRHQKALRLRRTILRLSANMAMVLIVLLPLLYAVSVAFMPPDGLVTTELNLAPKHPTLGNFKEALTKIPLVRFVCNSFLVAGLITVGQIVSCSLAAFSFSFLHFKGKKLLFMLVMATMMIPGEATIISNYLMVSGWGWLDSYQALMYMWPLLVTGSDKMRTVQIGISMLDSVDSQSITLMIAGVVMIILPSLSIFIFGQKQLIRGMFSGAVKG